MDNIKTKNKITIYNIINNIALIIMLLILILLLISFILYFGDIFPKKIQ